MADIELVLQPPPVIDLTIEAADVLQLQVRPPAPIQLAINTGTTTYNIQGGLNVVGTANEIDVTIANQTATIGIASPVNLTNVTIDQSLLVDATSQFNDDATFSTVVNLDGGTNLNADMTAASGVHYIGDILGNITHPCKNTSGGTLQKGTPVYITGTVGATNVVEVAKAVCDSFQTMVAVGVLESTLANNATGHFISQGVLTDVDTSGWSASADVYVSNTAGNLSNTKNYGLTITEPPKVAATSQGPQQQPVLQRIGHVGRVNANNGTIFIHAGIGAEKSRSMFLDDLGDCQIASNGVVVDTYVLMKLPGGGNSVWQDVATTSSGFSLVGHTHNQTAFIPAPSSQWNGKSMVWDHVNQLWNYKTMPLAEAYSANQIPIADGAGGWVAYSTLPLGMMPSHTHGIDDITDFKESKVYVESDCNSAGEFTTIALNSPSNLFTSTSLDVVGRFGILNSGTGSSANAVGGIGSAQESDMIAFGSHKHSTTAIINIPVLSTSTDRFVFEHGFSDLRSGTPTDGAFIQYSDNVNSGKFYGLIYNNNINYTYDLGITVAANTWYKLRTVVNADRSVQFYIDGVLKATSGAGEAPLGTTSTARRCGLHCLIRKTVGTTTRNLYTDYLNLQIDTAR